MGCKVLCPSVALLAYLIIGQHVRAQCTQPSFASRNVILKAEHFSTPSFPDGSNVTFDCEIGHKPADLKASKSVTCRGNQWTSLELSCTRKPCPSLPDFHNGRYEMNGNLFGDTAKPVCDKGYMLAGRETTRTCRDQGWDGRDPLCEPVKCLAPPAIENGQLEDEPLESYEYSQAVSYRCNGGLNLIGQSTLHCSEDGTFKPDPPKCFDGCPTPKIPNSKRTGGKSPPYKLGNFVEYKCEDGYTMAGIGYIVCRANGWDPEPPRCIENCPLPELSEHVTLTEEFRSRGSFPHGSNVIVECISGYEPVDATVSKTITCEETKWTKSPLTCKAVKCLAPPAIENGQLEDEPLESYEYSQAVSYRCNGGLNLIGQSTLHCSEDGTFKPDPPKCFDGCPTPKIPNAKRIGGKSPPYKLGNFVEYKCEDGYTMTGKGFIVCRANGWDPEPPRCTAAKCQAPPIIENGQIEAVFYKCNSGFFLNGRSSLYCSEDGTFKQDLPKCLEGPVCDGTRLGKQRHDSNPV